MRELSEAARLDQASLLADERAELLAFLETLAADQWALPTECPAWSVKGIALHLLGDDLSILSRQRDGEPSRVALEAGPDWESLSVALDRHNEAWVSASSYFSVPLLLDHLRLSGGQTDVWYSTVEPDRLGEPIPWIGPEPTPYWLLRAREYLERWIHQSQIRRAVGRGEWYDEKWVHPAAAVAVRGFPAGFATLPADEGTSVTVAIENGPKWSVIRHGTAWRLYDGSPPDPTVTVSMNNVTAALLFSRGMTAAQVVEGLELAGDEETGQMLAIGLSAFFGR